MREPWERWSERSLGSRILLLKASRCPDVSIEQFCPSRAGAREVAPEEQQADWLDQLEERVQFSTKPKCSAAGPGRRVVARNVLPQQLPIGAESFGRIKLRQRVLP